MTTPSPRSPVPPDFFASIPMDGTLDAVVLFKRNGQSLAAWTRKPASVDVITVMAATMLGSLETMLETLGEPGIPSLTMAVGSRRIYIQRVEPQAAILLVAPASVSEEVLRDHARNLVSKLPASGGAIRAPKEPLRPRESTRIG